MAGNGDEGERDGVAARIRALLEETTDLTTDELERRAKALNVLARAEQTLADLARDKAQAEREEAYIDDAAEGALRDQLMRRMVALAAADQARPGDEGSEA